jgi:hypothetical protein
LQATSFSITNLLTTTTTWRIWHIWHIIALRGIRQMTGSFICIICFSRKHGVAAVHNDLRQPSEACEVLQALAGEAWCTPDG